MEFEHIVQINDPNLTDIEFTSRDQLWLQRLIDPNSSMQPDHLHKRA